MKYLIFSFLVISIFSISNLRANNILTFRLHDSEAKLPDDVCFVQEKDNCIVKYEYKKIKTTIISKEEVGFINFLDEKINKFLGYILGIKKGEFNLVDGEFD
ncbi:MAG: hypothetical protein ABIA74_03410 [bacterium]